MRLIENVDPETHIFNGENNKQYDVIGTNGNDTINPGATYYYSGNYGTNIIRPNAGADVIKFTNYYDEETQSYLKSHNEILMGTDETPDTLWFANVTEKSSLNLSREGNNLVIYTREADTSDVEVVLKDFFTYPEPTTFINVKIGDGEGEDNNFKLTDISHQFEIRNYEDKKPVVNGSMFKENIITDKDTAEVINAGAGNDSVHSGSNGLTDYADTIYLGDGDDTLSYGYIGNDGMEVYGGDGNDSIEVCSGVVYGGAGSDYIYVGNDNDYRNAHDGAYRNNVTVYGGTSEAGGGNPEDLDSIRGSEGNDLIYGADGSDSIYGNEGNDTIYGNAGNDTIDGYYGDDSIIGGAGADSINGYYGDDTILGGDGNDTIYGGDGDDYIDGGDGDDLIYSDSVSGFVDDYGTIKGGAGNDTIYNNSYSCEVWGDEGDDTITTRYDSYNTNYHFKKGDGHDVINPADSYSYSTNGTIVFDDIAFEEDNITGVLDREAGTLTITYNNGQDSIVVNNYCTNSGGMYDMDAIFGAVQYIVDKNGVKKFIGEFVKMPHEEIGGTTTSYTVFSDDITFTSGGSHIGGLGNDTFVGSEYNDLLIGDYGDTTEGCLDGGHDYLDGRGGYNTIYGGQGDDTLVGGYDEKADSLYGGLGTNTYIIATPRVDEAQTEIYSNSEDDILDFSNIANFDAFAVESGDLKMTYSADGKYGYVLIKGWATNPVDYTVKLAGDTTSSLSKIMTESNFMNASFVTGNTETQQSEGVKIGSDGADTITAYYDVVNNRSIAVGAAGDDEINGTTNNDVLMGGDGNDYISGKAGDDIIYGGDGNDTIMGSTGTDTIYGGKGSDLIYGGDDADVIFAGTKPMFSIDYINETYAPFTVSENLTYETGANDTSTTVYGEGGNDTIVAFGCNSILYGQDGDDLYHVMYGTNKTTISDTVGSNTLQLHGENNNYHQGYIVMNVKQSDGAITKLMVVDENDYADWKNNNGRLSEGHYGIEITSGIDTFTIKDTSNLSVTGTQIDEFRAAIAGFLEGKEGVTDVAAALGNENYRDDMIAVFDSYNNGGANNMWQ